MSSIPKCCLNSMQDSLSLNFTPHIHPVICISAWCNASSISLSTSHFHITYNSVHIHHKPFLAETGQNRPLIQWNKHNNRVSYRKQRVSIRHKTFGQARWRGQPCIMFFSSSLIIMENLVTVSHTVCMQVGGSQKFGDAGMGRGWHLETLPFPHLLLCWIWSI